LNLQLKVSRFLSLSVILTVWLICGGKSALAQPISPPAGTNDILIVEVLNHVEVSPRQASTWVLTQTNQLLHPGDRPLWELTHGGPGDANAVLWDADLTDGQTLTIGGTTLRVLHTPGHAPGAVCLYAPDLGCVFTGDTLFHGGPGATGRSYSDRATLEASIRAKLFALPADTIVHTGHGEDTTIGAEKALLG